MPDRAADARPAPSGSAPLRVLQLASGDAWGGAERVVSLLVRGLVARAEVSVSALLLNDGQLAGELRALGCEVELAPESGRGFFALLRAVRRAIRARRPDVVHAHRYKEIVLATAAVAGSATRLVVTVHGLERRAQMGLGRTLLAWGSLALARLAGARFVAVSRELAERMQRTLRLRSVPVVPNPMPELAHVAGNAAGIAGGVDVRAALGWKPERPVVAFVGRLEDVKGPDLFVEIAASLPPEIGCVLIGAGRLEHSLRASIAQRGLGERTRLLGQVPDAGAYLADVDLLALTSRHEGTPMVLLEAAACRVPVVAFAVGGVPDVLSGAPAEWLVAPGDVQAFARRVESVLADASESRAGLERWARTAERRYSFDAVIGAYLSAYRAP